MCEEGSAALAEYILLPLPSAFTKGVLVLLTLYGHLCTGPTAEDQHDKREWRLRPAALAALPPRSRCCPRCTGRRARVVDAWARLRPAGRPHNYFCRFSERLPGVPHLAGIRSTGLSACLGLSSWALERLRGSTRVEAVGLANQGSR